MSFRSTLAYSAVIASVFVAVCGAARAESGAAAQKIKRTEIISADNWTITCVTPDKPGARRACSADLKIVQTDQASNASRVVFNWIVGKEGAKPTSVIVVPTGVLIAPGIGLKVGEKKLKPLPYVLCQPDRCEATLEIDEGLAKLLSSQEKAEFSVTGANGAVARFAANLKGFEEAWTAIGK